MPGKKKNSLKDEELTAKFIKAFTGPKKEPPLLINLKWFKINEHFWTTMDDVKSVGLEENTFYLFYDEKNVNKWFCSIQTFREWEMSARSWSYIATYKTDSTRVDLMNSLYKILTMDYYDEA